MALRYWVGGTGTWDSTNTANWSATSGGPGGASVPTAADDVIFNSSSGGGSSAYTVNCTSGQAICLSLNAAGIGSPARLTLSGAVEVKDSTTCGSFATFTNLTITLTPAVNMALSASGTSPVFGPNVTVNFNSNVTYTVSIGGVSSGTNTFVANAGTISSTTFGTAGTNNLTVAGGTVNASGTNYGSIFITSGSLIQSGALTASNIGFYGGTFSRGTNTTTVNSFFDCSSSNARTLSGTGTFTLAGSGTIFSCSTATNLTLSNATTLSITNITTNSKTLFGAFTGDTASNTFSLNIAGTATGTFDISGAFFNVTINGTTTKTLLANGRKIYGDWNGNVSGLTYGTGTFATTFAATTTGRTAAFNSTADLPLIFDGVGGDWTLTWPNTTASFSDITVENGSLTFANVNTTIRSLISNNSNTRTIVLPTSNPNTLTVTGTTPINFFNGTNLTLNVGTGIIACSSSVVNFNGGGKTFATVNFTSPVLSSVNIAGANTFGNIDFPTLAATFGVATLTLGANLTFTGSGTFNIGTSFVRRLFIRSDQLGVQRTITRVGSGTANFTDCDFQDIAFSNITITTGTNAGDCGGNSGITFRAGRLVYWNQAGGGNWSSTSWALSNGGTPSSGNFPLPQDTVQITDFGLTTGNTITIDAGYNLPTIQSLRNNAWTLAGTVSNRIFGDLTLNSTTTASYSGTLTFQKRSSSQTITSNGVALNSPIVVDSWLNGFVFFSGASLNLSGRSLTVNNGTFEVGSASLFCGSIVVNLTATEFSVTSGGFISCTDWTFPENGPTLSLNANSTLSFSGTFNGGSRAYPNTVVPASGLTNTINGSNTFNVLSRPPVASTLRFQAGSTQTITGTFLAGGVPSGNRILLRSTASGTRYNLSKSSGTVSVNSLDIQDSNATGGATWEAYTTNNNNIDSGNNSGWVFLVPTNFLILFT